MAKIELSYSRVWLIFLLFLIIRNCAPHSFVLIQKKQKIKAVKPELKKARFAKMFETHFG